MENEIFVVMVSILALVAGFMLGVNNKTTLGKKKDGICAGCGKAMHCENDSVYPYCSKDCRQILSDYLNEQ